MFKELKRYIQGGLFKRLDDNETLNFIQWARENYEPLTKISVVWHPVIQIECHSMNSKAIKKEWNYFI